MITSKMHGILDYVTVLIFALSPSLFNLSETGAAIAYTLAVVHLLMTVFTGFSMGIIKVIPFQYHGYVELTVGVILAAAPWLLTTILSYTDQLYFSVMGGIIFLVWLLTTYKSPLSQ